MRGQWILSGGWRMHQHMVELLKRRGVELRDIADIVYVIQYRYQPGLTVEECTECVVSVLGKREVQHALWTGIALDQLAEEERLPEPLQTLLSEDHPLYGIDEVLALGITNIYGSIGLTNFGYLDKQKIGVLERLHVQGKEHGTVHTFLDDLVAGIAAAAASKLAHHRH